MPEETLKILPIGGLEEIGKNMTVLEYQNEIIIIDCGFRFPTPKTVGIDYIINDYQYLINNKDKVKGILITHGHLDHIGGLPYLINKINIPIYAYQFTLALIRKIVDNNIKNKRYKLIPFETHKPFQIGKFFSCEAINIHHSIIDAVSFAIKTPVGTIIHSGDYRTKGLNKTTNDYLKFEQYSKSGVLLLLADSTNSFYKKDIPSEEEINKNFEDIILRSKSRIIISTFATQIERIKSILSLAKKHKKYFAFSGRSMKENIELALKFKISR